MEISNIRESKFTLPKTVILYDDDYRPVEYSHYTPDKPKDQKKGKKIGEITIPSELIPKFISETLVCTVSNTLPVYINSLRRVLQTELSTYAMHINLEGYVSTDPIIDFDKIEDILTSIPIMQDKISLDDKFYVNVKNSDVANAGTIYTHHIKNKQSKSLVDLGICNDMILFTIYPNASIAFAIDIKYMSGAQKGQHSACYNVGMNCLSQSTIYTDKNKYELTVTTNGHIKPLEAIKQSITHIQKRYDTLYDELERSINTITERNLYKFVFNNETHTIVETLHIELNYGEDSDKILFVSTHKAGEPLIKLEIRTIYDKQEDVIDLLKKTIKTCRSRFNVTFK